jgi:hypothetical protein
MTDIRIELVYAVINEVVALVVHNNIDEQYEFRKQTILADENLTNDEKLEAIKILTVEFDKYKMLYNEGKKRICEICQGECLTTLYCEHCIRNDLKTNFSNWTSENNNIDNLIQKCQMESLGPNMIVRWIPYNNFQNIEYLTNGGCSKIYTAEWIDWDSEIKAEIKEVLIQEVILKKLENVGNANKSWLEEVNILKIYCFYIY